MVHGYFAILQAEICIFPGQASTNIKRFEHTTALPFRLGSHRLVHRNSMQRSGTVLLVHLGSHAEVGRAQPPSTFISSSYELNPFQPIKSTSKTPFPHTGFIAHSIHHLNHRVWASSPALAVRFKIGAPTHLIRRCVTLPTTPSVGRVDVSAIWSNERSKLVGYCG